MAALPALVTTVLVLTLPFATEALSDRSAHSASRQNCDTEEAPAFLTSLLQVGLASFQSGEVVPPPSGALEQQASQHSQTSAATGDPLQDQAADAKDHAAWGSLLQQRTGHVLSLLQGLGHEVLRGGERMSLMTISSVGISSSHGRTTGGGSMAFVLILVVVAMAVVAAVGLQALESSGPAQQQGGYPLAREEPRLSEKPRTSVVRQARFQVDEVQEKQLPPTSGAATQPAIVGPPPICVSLILPNTEARFLIAMDKLNELLRIGGGPVDILGTSGRKLLHASIETGPGGGAVSIASVGCEDDPRATVIAVAPGLFEIFGKRRSTYGSMESHPTGAIVKVNGAPGMIIDIADRASFTLNATGPTGRPLATASRSPQPLPQMAGAPATPGPTDCWKLTVKPGVDAILIMVTMLALMALQPDARVSITSRISMTPGASQVSLAPSLR